MTEQEIFAEAMSRTDPEARRKYLEEACGENHSLRARLTRLLQKSESLGDFLEQPANASIAGVLTTSGHLAPGTWIGPYKIREPLGDGGMGVVYVAEQVRPVRRKVALKIVKPGMATKDVIYRFEAERQALAMMHHPNIARVLDGGETEAGHPYFVMELVRGIPITEFCDRQKLDTRRRLEMFITVCRAVQHAHLKGIIHRDLKPSNVLVESHVVEAVPKVIDFGVAKAIGERLTEHTVYTRFTQLIGTPLYMSPEQAQLTALDVDVRSDVYSLGVMLYELLTGTTPFEKEELNRADFDEMRRIIREVDPPRPSQKVSTLNHALASTVSTCRQTDPRSLSLSMNRELDWIIMKCLEKDRARRYESVNALADDIQRYLSNEPVQACPPSWRYLAGKYVRRHKVLFATTAVVLLSILTGAAVSLNYARRSAINARNAIAAEEQSRRFAAEAQQAKKWADTLLYAAEMKLAADALVNGDVARSRELVQRHAPRSHESHRVGFEWHYLHKLVSGPSRDEFRIGSEVNDIAACPDGKRLAIASVDSTVRVYRLTTWDSVAEFETTAEAVNSVAWSADGAMLAAACTDGTVSVWNTTTGQGRSRLQAHSGETNDVAFSPDGTVLYTCGDDHVAKRWNLSTGELIATFKGHEREIDEMAISPDGTKLATASADRSFIIWDTANAEILHYQRVGFDRMVCVSFSHSGQQIAIGDNRGGLFLIDTESGERIEVGRQTDGLQDVVFSREDELLSTIDRSGTIQVFKVADLRASTDDSLPPRPIRWIGHDARGTSLATTPDHQLLVSAGRDGYVRQWHLDLAATQWSTTRFPWSIRHLAVGSNDRLHIAGDGGIHVWDMQKRTLIRTALATGERWWSIDCTPDGQYLAAAAQGRIVLVDANNFDVLQAWSIAKSAEPDSISISPDGQHIAIGEYSTSDSVSVYHVGQAMPVAHLPAAQCRTLKYSPDGKWLAVVEMDNLALYDLQSGGDPLMLRGHTSTLSGVAFSPDSSVVATVSHDRLLKIWSLPEANERFSIVAHQDRVRTVAFSGDGQTIATGGEDGAIRLWHVATGQPLGNIARLDEWVKEIKFSHDGSRLICRPELSFLVVFDAESPVRSNPRDNTHTHTQGEFVTLDRYTSAHEHETIIDGISRNGQFAAGMVKAGKAFHALKWSRAEGMVRFKESRSNCQTSMIADNGTLAIGSGAAKWTARLWTSLDQSIAVAQEWSHAVQMTPDGRIVVGRHWDEEAARSKAFRWQDGETEYLQATTGHQHSEAVAVTPDGSKTLVYLYNATTKSDGRRVKLSNEIRDARSAIWTTEGLELIPGLDSSFNWEPSDLSDDGSVIVGTRWPEGWHHHTPVDVSSGLAFRWEDGQVELLGSVVGAQHSVGRAVSGDGRIVVGNSVRQFKTDSWDDIGFIWQQGVGMASATETLAEAGIHLANWQIRRIVDVSQDGYSLVGNAISSNGQWHGMWVKFPDGFWETRSRDTSR